MLQEPTSFTGKDFSPRDGTQLFPQQAFGYSLDGSCSITAEKINIFVSQLWEEKGFAGNSSVVSFSLNAVSGWDPALRFWFKQKLRWQPTHFKQRILSWFNHLHFPISGYTKMQGNCVSECISLFLGLGLTKFPWKVQATKAAGGCYPAEYWHYIFLRESCRIKKQLDLTGVGMGIKRQFLCLL